jgi:phosphate transport system substrate-binding protein
VKALLALVLLVCAPPVFSDVIRIKGSDLLGAKLVPLLCEEYRKQHPEARFEIAAEGTFATLPGFLAGGADILMASRELDPKQRAPFEKAGIVLQRVDAVTQVTVIVVHAANPVDELSLAEVEGLFTGDHASWKAVGGLDAPVSLYVRNSASSSYKDFQRAAMKGRPYAKSSVRLGGGESPAMMVAKDPHGITYMGPMYARQKGLKVVSIDGIDPLGKDVGRYPLLQPAYYYHRGDARAEVQAFVRWMSTSPESRKLAETTGFLVPDEVSR